MINYIGQSQKEKSNSIIRVKIKKQKSFFTLLLLAVPLIFLLFDNSHIKEKVTGDRMATCKIVEKGNPAGYCTAFLVSENGFLISAGHCFKEQSIGDIVYVTFDKAGFNEVPAKIVHLTEDYSIDDFAVLQLQRKIDFFSFYSN